MILEEFSPEDWGLTENIFLPEEYDYALIGTMQGFGSEMRIVYDHRYVPQNILSQALDQGAVASLDTSVTDPDTLGDLYDNLLRIDGQDSAVAGLIFRADGVEALAYDTEGVLNNLVEEGMSWEEAQEWWDYNMIGAFMGERTPVYVNIVRQAQALPEPEPEPKEPHPLAEELKDEKIIPQDFIDDEAE